MNDDRTAGSELQRTQLGASITRHLFVRVSHLTRLIVDLHFASGCARTSGDPPTATAKSIAAKDKYHLIADPLSLAARRIDLKNQATPQRYEDAATSSTHHSSAGEENQLARGAVARGEAPLKPLLFARHYCFNGLHHDGHLGVLPTFRNDDLGIFPETIQVRLGVLVHSKVGSH